MFAPRLHRQFAGLALFAMLLLAFSPTVSRLLTVANAAAGSWIEMCTFSGLAWVKVPSGQDAGIPKATVGVDADCAYCPLINAMTAMVMLVIAVFPSVRALATRRLRLSWPPVVARHGGLGSRGPPIPL